MSKLAAILDDMKIVHVRGTPATGKTCLSELLRDYYRDKGRKVFLITKWEDLSPEDPWGSLIELVKKRNKGFSSPEQDSCDLSSDTVILVDEAQKSYTDEVLWNTVLKERQATTCVYNFRLCLFCSYGNPNTGPDETFFTPVNLSHGKRISLTPQNLQGSPSIGLFYDKEEFKDAVSRLLAFQCPERFSFGENAQDYVFALTDGYPGAVTAIVNVLLQVCVNKLYTSPLFISLASFVTLFECPRNGAY